ncbi:hypothetical protein ACOTFF_17000 [Achromobacter xylosoxidans]
MKQGHHQGKIAMKEESRCRGFPASQIMEYRPWAGKAAGFKLG